MNSDYNIGVHALVYLAHRGCPLQSAALAENICANPARVRKVLAKLTHAGLLLAKEGRFGGGYRLARPAADITLADVSDALDTRFVSTGWQSGDPNRECLIASGMAGLMEEVYQKLDAVCRAKLREITVADVEKKITHNGEGASL